MPAATTTKKGKSSSKKADATPKMPTAAQMDKMRKEDEGFSLASTDAVKFLHSRKQAVYNIARRYHLDPEELLQEGYEVLLTCLRDYTPVYEKPDGSIVTVQFTTFFGNRMDSRGMEMRNRDPEYQARQAYTDSMSSEEKERFRSDPPLLVQHLDQETTVQEALRSEVSEARQNSKGDLGLKIARDSFFDQKLNELVAKEKDEKKRAALLHVKVGGVYNFQEIAYHFGVTDSRASQVMNELMDAFYVQRLLDQDITSVAYDFKKLKFNDKRCHRLLNEALENAPPQRAQEIVDIFNKDYPDIAKLLSRAQTKKPAQIEQDATPEKISEAAPFRMPPPAYENLFDEEENEQYPLVSVDLRPISELHEIEVEFRRPEDGYNPATFAKSFDIDSAKYPALVTEDGHVIDGWRRIEAAKLQGKDKYLCITRDVPDETEQKILRVTVNLRLRKPDKTELYYAISALADLGLSQQKIADHVGTSRTNVLVYAKVRDKAAPKLRALFEDGLIQITNASSCVDLSEEIQGQLADFIRRYGPEWSKGNKFNQLHQAANEDRVSKLEKDLKPVPQQVPQPKVDESQPLADAAAQRTITSLQSRVEAYEQALKDSEVWTAQREKVISSQAEVLEEAQNEIDSLRRELETSELLKFGSKDAIEAELKELKQFYALSERLSSAAHSINHAVRDLKRLELKRKQGLELKDMMDEVEKGLNTLRLEMLNRGYKQDAKSSDDEEQG